MRWTSKKMKDESTVRLKKKVMEVEKKKNVIVVVLVRKNRGLSF